MYKIRPMAIEDYKEIIKLWKNIEGVGINEYDDSKKSIRKFLQMNPKTCFVAEKENIEIIGTILGGYDGRRGLIYHLMVKSEHRKTGIGKELIEKVEKEFKKQGIKRIYIVTFKENEIGNKFWEKNGYEIRESINFRSKKIE